MADLSTVTLPVLPLRNGVVFPHMVVTVTIDGAEDAPVLGGDGAGTVAEDGAGSDSGTLTISDTDTADNPVTWNDVAATAGDNGYGTFEISGNTWTYNLDNGHAAVQALDAGETLTDTYTFTASDASTQVVTGKKAMAASTPATIMPRYSAPMML